MVGYTPPVVPYQDNPPNTTTPIYSADLNNLTSAVYNLDCTFLPCDLATTGAITRSGLAVVVDGITASTPGMRVLDLSDPNPVLRGIYIAGAGTWARSSDMAIGSIFRSGSTVRIRAGTKNVGAIYSIDLNGAATGIVNTSNLNIYPITHKILNNGNGTTFRPALNFTSGFTVTDNSTGASTDVSAVAVNVGPSPTVLSFTSGTTVYLVATQGFSKITLTSDAMIAFDETVDNAYRSFKLLVEQDTVGGWKLYWTPGTVIWEEGVEPQISTAPGSFLAIEGTWWGASYGLIARTAASASKYITRMPDPWNGITLGVHIDVMRGMRAGTMDALASILNTYTVLAHRQRLGLNAVSTMAFGERFSTDSWVGAPFRTGYLYFGGFELGPNSANAAYRVATSPTRTVTDGVVTSGSSIITSATANFNYNYLGNTVVADNGAAITGSVGIPPNTIIKSVTNPTTAVMGNYSGATVNATASATGVTFTIQQGPDSLDPVLNGSVIHEYFHIEHASYFAGGYTDPGTGVHYPSLLEHPTTIGLYNTVSDNATSRTITDGVLNSGSTTMTSPSANFTYYNISGATVTGPGIPGGTTVIDVLSTTSVRMSNAATASGTGLSIVIQQAGRSSVAHRSRTVTDGVTNATATITSATASFVLRNDIGAAISGSGIPAGTTISTVINATTAVLSVPATASASGVTLAIQRAGNYAAEAEWWSQMRASKHVYGIGSPDMLATAGNDSQLVTDFDSWITTLAIIGG